MRWSYCSLALTWWWLNGNIIRVTGPCIRRSTVNYPLKIEWRGALVFSLICTSTNSCANSRDAGDSRRNEAIYILLISQSHLNRVCFMLTTWHGNALHNWPFVWGIQEWEQSKAKVVLLLLSWLTHLSVMPHICITELGHHWLTLWPSDAI